MEFGALDALATKARLFSRGLASEASQVIVGTTVTGWKAAG